MTATDPLGHQVSALEVKDADLAPTMVRALARQAAAEREKQDKIIAIVFPIPIEPFRSLLVPTDGLVPVSTIRGGTCSVAHDETWSRVVRGFLPGQTSASAAHAAPSGPGD